MIILFAVFIIVVVLAYCLSELAPRLGLLAHPGEHRRHQEPTPLVGGIAIFIGISFGVLLLDQSYLNLFPSLFILCFVGVLDDRYKLPSWFRFAAQAIAVYIMIELTGVRLSNLGSLLSINQVQLGVWTNPLTIFATIGVINALNMSDGLDGLAGLLTILILASILLISPELNSLIAISIVAIFGFLFWNLRFFRYHARLFMGDAGSTILGLIVAYLLISSSQEPLSNIPPVTALWLVALPLFDAVAVLFMRPLRGQSPFTADRIHYHHLIHDRYLSTNQTLFVILLLQGTLMFIGLLMLWCEFEESTQLFVFMFFFCVYFLILVWVTRDEENV